MESSIKVVTGSPTNELAGLDLSMQSVCSIRSNYPVAPMLTPCSSSDSLPLQSIIATRPGSKLLDPVFPAGLKDLEALYDVTATLPAGLQGALVDVEDGSRSIYILGLTAPSISKESVKVLVVEVLDLADEKLEGDDVIFVLDKNQPSMRELLQGLLYVGGNVIRDDDNSVADSFVLVGIAL